MKLLEELHRDVELEAQRKRDLIEQHRGLIAECEALAESLNKAAIGHRFAAHAYANLALEAVTCRVYVAFERASAVRETIRRAGLKIHGETESDVDTIGLTQHFVLADLSVPVVLVNVQAEATEALKEAA